MLAARSIQTIFLCLLLAAPVVSCAPPAPPRSALPGCDRSDPTETRASLEGEARRALEEKDARRAARALKKASCYEGTPDPLLADAIARLVLLDLIQEGYRVSEAARLFSSTPGGAETLWQIAQQAPPNVAVGLFRALAEAGDTRAKDPLLAFLKDPSGEIRAEALLGLLQLGLLDEKDAAAALSDPDHRVRLAGVEIAARRAPKLLEQAALDPLASVRISVAASLSALDPEDGAVLAALLTEDPNPGVRLAAFESGYRIGLTRQEALSGALGGEDPYLAIAAARLAGPEDPEAVRVLLAALAKEGEERQSAILISGSFGSAARKIVPALLKITSFGTAEERVLAAAALLRLEPRLPVGKMARQAQEESHETLSALCETEGRPAVRGCAELSPRGDLRARERLKILARKDPDPLARSAALRALALLGLPFLGDIAAGLADEDPGVRLAAAGAVLKVVGTLPKGYGR